MVMLWTRHAAKAMGLEISPAAYLSLTGPINMDGFTGVNYASECAKILSINDEMVSQYRYVHNCIYAC